MAHISVFVLILGKSAEAIRSLTRFAGSEPGPSPPALGMQTAAFSPSRRALTPADYPGMQSGVDLTARREDDLSGWGRGLRAAPTADLT